MSVASAARPRPLHLDRPAPAVQLEGVSKWFGRGRQAVQALEDVSLEVAAGEFLCVVGASGCGKSTLLSILAGLEQPSQGEVVLTAGRPALMFQEHALLPWLTARRNVELPLRLRRAPALERRETVDRLMEIVGLTRFAERRPHELSGGMRQRIALARALAQGSGLLLMDEPFAQLDAITRDALHEDLERIWEEAGVTVVFVTHNVAEAVRLGDRIVLMASRPGRIAEVWDVEIPRRRSLESPRVAALAAQITGRLREEARLAG